MVFSTGIGATVKLALRDAAINAFPLALYRLMTSRKTWRLVPTDGAAQLEYQSGVFRGMISGFTHFTVGAAFRVGATATTTGTTAVVLATTFGAGVSILQWERSVAFAAASTRPQTHNTSSRPHD